MAGVTNTSSFNVACACIGVYREQVKLNQWRVANIIATFISLKDWTSFDLHF